MTSPVLPYRLEDRYERTDGRVHLTGIQALARIAVEQLRMDRAAGLRTAALLSGYPGSPLGGFDMEVGRLLRQVTDLPIVHQPAVNEELGASAVMGSQLAASRPDAKHDGVVGFWYGKAPGLDRATDAIRHGVFAGTARTSGAVALVGDDPMAKSSTMPSSSDAALISLHMPILYPGNAQECLELGLHAVAISRASGLWSAMKIVTPVADGGGTVDLPVLDTPPILPELEVDGVPWRNTPSAVFLGPRMVDVEREFHEVRSVLAHRYGVENKLNRATVDPDDAWIGLVATGFTYHQLLDALQRLGFADEGALAAAGIRLLQLRMPVPFDRDLVRRFARGLEEIVVVEEKNPSLEWLIKDALYGGPNAPRVLGKTHEDGRQLMRTWGRLDADAIAPGLRERLSPKLEGRMIPPTTGTPARERTRIPLSVNRTPFFCSGCPHNWGTKVPEGTLVGAGTGCHGMSLLMDPERVGETIGITAMGNEGAHWIGMSPFVETEHIVQNFGDGTFFHSGQLAVQAAIGAGTDITFKILYNDTVAMTGGQDASHQIGVPALCRSLLAHGVQRILVTTDDVDDYDRRALPGGVELWDRTRILEAQETLAAISGVTVLIHHQGCAAELRRDRKRGRIDTPTERIVINHRICEGCGDCGDVSNCLSVQPLDTPLGRKTTIDQASCNIDRSCLQGDCPSFMTVDVTPASTQASDGAPPVPAPPTNERTHFALRLAGIGGTGVVTVAQILATAAMFDGWDVQGLDQTGLSQKAGPVVSDLVLTRKGATASNVIGVGAADAVIAFDQMVAASDRVVGVMGPATRVVGSTHHTPTGAIVADPFIPYPAAAEFEDRFARGEEADDRWMDAAEFAERLVGSPAAANVFVLGAAVQLGAVPVAGDHLEEAIRLNGIAVDANLAALTWGRAWADDPAGVAAAAAREGSGEPEVIVAPLPAGLARRVDAFDPALHEQLRIRTADLVGWQDAEWAAGFLITIERVAAAEAAVDPTSFALTAAAAHGLHKFMAYKDEYEVARLMLAPEAEQAVRSAGGSAATMAFHLHPPLLRAVGVDRKLRFTAKSRRAFAVLARGKRLRGTAADPFGRAEVRKVERELIVEYEELLDMLIAGLRAEPSADRLGRATTIAELADSVRGFEDLKLARAAEYREAVRTALQGW
jgi:indolepyruvate ferredoxin oxidoreductase